MRHELQPETLDARPNQRPDEDITTGCEGGARGNGTAGGLRSRFTSPGRRVAADAAAGLQRLGQRVKEWFH